jgi:phosphonate transport system substrate-binding protein
MAGTSRSKALRIGAVAYDPKVVTIWEGFKDYFAACGVEIDFILYSTYDAQVEANLCEAIAGVPVPATTSYTAHLHSEPRPAVGS